MKIDRPAYERNHLWRCRTRSCYRFGPGPDQHTDEDDGYSYFLTHDGSIESLRAVVETCGHNTTRGIVLPAEYLGMVGNRDGLIDGRAFHDMMAAIQKERDAMIKRDDAVKGNDHKTDNDLIRGDAMNQHDGGLI